MKFPRRYNVHFIKGYTDDTKHRPTNTLPGELSSFASYFLSVWPVCLCAFSALTADAVGWAAGRASGLKNLSDEVLAWLSVWSEVQMICIWCSWSHCHPIISCSSKIQNGLPFWCRLTQVVLEKRPLNGCSSSSSSSWPVCLTCMCRERGQLGGRAVVVCSGDVWNCPAAHVRDAAAEFHVISSLTSSTARHRSRRRLLPRSCRCDINYDQYILLGYYSYN